MGQVRAIFPNGNPSLIRRFVEERPGYVAELTALFQADAIDPAFLRRFTRSADPRWAAFHTLCTSGQPPPVRPLPPEPIERRLERRAEDPEADFAALSGGEKRDELIALYRQGARLYLDARAGEPEPALVSRLEAAIAQGEAKERLERTVFEALGEARGRPIGPAGGVPASGSPERR